MKKPQTGFAVLSVLLATIALLALVATAIGTMSRGPDMASGVGVEAAAMQIVGQTAGPMAQLALCAMSWPLADNGTGFHPRYPGGSGTVRSRDCPGTGARIFDVTNGFVMVAPPPGYAGWDYVNDAASVRITLTANDAGHVPALVRAAQKIGPAASVTGSTLSVMVTR